MSADKFAPNVTILCSGCGREIWEWTAPETTFAEMKRAICSDCLLKEGRRMRYYEKVVQIAQIAHETNRAYCQSIGDDSQPPWEDAPEWQRQSVIKGVEFHLTAHARGETPAPSASHDSWLAEKKEQGWKYGPVKDAEKKEHPCYVSYDQLPVEQKLKDYLFGHVVAAFVQAEKGNA